MKKITQVLLAMVSIALSINLNAQVGSGNAYDFSSDNIIIPNSTSLSPTSTITVEAWIKADSWAANSWQNVIVSKDGWASGNQGYTLRAGANGTLSFNLAFGPSWYEAESAPVMVAGRWYHVAGTYDGSNINVYINGELAGTTPISGTINQGSYDVSIGNIVYAPGGTRYFDGIIDEVRIWGTALPQSSIQEYMCKHISSAHAQFGSLAANWKFDAAGTVVDESVNGNDGTVNGANLVLSGAALGDESVYAYGGGVIDLTLDYMGMDSLNVLTNTVDQTVHIYRVDGASTSNLSGGVSQIDNTHYYGVFTAGSTAYSYNSTYYYGASPFFAGNESYADLAGRTNNGLAWSPTSSNMNTTANTFDNLFTQRRELVPAIICDQPNLNVSGSVTICDGDTVQIVNSGTNTINQWHDANGPIAGATSATYNALTSGDYFVVVNAGICTDSSDIINVTVTPLPQIDFGTTPTTYCENDGTTMLNMATPSGGLYSGNGVSGGQFDPATAGVGSSFIYYQVASSGCVGMDSLQVTVGSAPATPTISQNGTQLCASPGAASYTWFINGTASTTTTECIDITVNGTYEVAAVSAEGCPSPVASFNVTDASISENALLSVNVAPNPTSGLLTVFVGNASEGTITINSLEGKLMIEQSINKTETELDLSSLPMGVYMLVINANNGTAVKRIVKK